LSQGRVERLAIACKRCGSVASIPMWGVDNVLVCLTLLSVGCFGGPRKRGFRWTRGNSATMRPCVIRTPKFPRALIQSKTRNARSILEIGCTTRWKLGDIPEGESIMTHRLGCESFTDRVWIELHNQTLSRGHVLACALARDSEPVNHLISNLLCSSHLALRQWC
jgi:hypothetical protein